MTDGYFVLDGGRFVPSAAARGPWSEDMMHGRLLGGLATRAIENEFVPPDWQIARLTVDLFRPAAMEPIQIETDAIRQGRKVRVADAIIHCGGHAVGRVTAVALITAEEPPGHIWRPDFDSDAWPDPDTLAAPTDGTGSAEVDGWWFRTVQGGFASGVQSRIWTNDTIPLVEGETLTPVVRAAVSGDFACPLANSSDQGLHYINADYTMLLGRYPVGDWVGIEVAQQIQAKGISMASATYVDRQGPFGTSGGASLVRPPLLPEDAG